VEDLELNGFSGVWSTG